MEFLFILVVGLTYVALLADLGILVFEERHWLNTGVRTLLQVLIMVLFPLLFLVVFDFNQANDCCSESAVFSPRHRSSIYVFIGICEAAFFCSAWRYRVAPPLLELLLNVLLVMGIVFNIFLAIHLDEIILPLIGIVPIVTLLLTQLVTNYHLLMNHFSTEQKVSSNIETTIYKILRWPFFVRFPMLMIVALPFLLLLSCLLLIFGQRSDSMILAFTDTYKHGLSELSCANVTCPDGHFLCTIAASGHKCFVQPLRTGVRQHTIIKVNRQLLVSNAFEDMLADQTPALHLIVRRIYNYIGGNCKRLYDILGNKWIADAVYIMMKPLEWAFLVSLYLFDRKPENRIAKQYLYTPHRDKIDGMSL